MSKLARGYVPHSQTKTLDLYNEINFELSKEELQEAVKLSGYKRKDRLQLTDEIDNKNITSTDRMWSFALSGGWKTMIDVDGWKLPGTFNKYAICGRGFFKKCPVDNFVRRFVYHCGRIGCEVCARRAGARAAKKIERRVWLYGLKVRYDTKSRKNPYPSHVIEAVDPKSEFWMYSKSKQKELLKKFRRIAGITGSLDISHLWAFDKSVLKPFYRPHKHLIAYGWINPDAYEEIKKEYGIEVNYVKVRNGTLKTRLDVFAVAFYQLSHCAVKSNKHSMKWSGDLSYRKISNKVLEKYKDEEYLKQDKDIEKTKRCNICCEKLLPAKINNQFGDWERYIPPDNQMKSGFIFPEGLFLSVDFMSGEKIPYYNEGFEPIYKKTRIEELELRNEKRPDLYNKKTINQTMDSFLNDEIIK